MKKQVFMVVSLLFAMSASDIVGGEGQSTEIDVKACVDQELREIRFNQDIVTVNICIENATATRKNLIEDMNYNDEVHKRENNVDRELVASLDMRLQALECFKKNVQEDYKKWQENKERREYKPDQVDSKKYDKL